MVHIHLYARLSELASQRHPQTNERRSQRHRGLQRSAREISLAVRRQRRHGESV